MPRVRLATLALVVLSSGCTRENPAFGIGLLAGSATDSGSDAGSDAGSEGSGSATGTSMGSTTASGSGSGGSAGTGTASASTGQATAATSGSSTGTGPLTTAAASPTSTDSSATDSSATDTGTATDTDGLPACGGFPGGFEPAVSVVGPEGELDPCTSGFVVLEGPVLSPTADGFVIEDCRGNADPCEPCEGPQYAVGAYVANAAHLPSPAVECAEVIVRYERTAWGACVTRAAAMFARDANNLGQVVDPFWLLLQYGIDPLIALPDDLRVEQYLEEATACACEQPDCCSDAPGFYELKLTGFEGGSLAVREGDEATGRRGGIEWVVAAYAAHHDGLCLYPMHIEFVAKAFLRP